MEKDRRSPKRLTANIGQRSDLDLWATEEGRTAREAIAKAGVETTLATTPKEATRNLPQLSQNSLTPSDRWGGPSQPGVLSDPAGRPAFFLSRGTHPGLRPGATGGLGPLFRTAHEKSSIGLASGLSYLLFSSRKPE